MRDTITVSLPPEILAQADEIADSQGITRGEVVTDALREYLFFHRSRDLRERMMVEARAQGLFTDEDVIDRIS